MTRPRRATASTTTTATATATAAATPPAGPFAVGDGPDGIALGAGAVWAVASRDGVLTRIDPQIRRDHQRRGGGEPRQRRRGVRLRLGLGHGREQGRARQHRPAARGDRRPSTWVTVPRAWPRPAGRSGSRTRVTARSRRSSRPPGTSAPSRTSAASRSRSRSAPARCGSPTPTAAASRASTAVRGQLVTTVDGIGPNPRAVAIVGRQVWVATADDGRVWVIEGDANRVVGNVRVGGQPRDITTDGEHLFVTDREGDRVVEIDPDAEDIVNERGGRGRAALGRRRRPRPLGHAVRRRRRRPDRSLGVQQRDDGFLEAMELVQLVLQRPEEDPLRARGRVGAEALGALLG